MRIRAILTAEVVSTLKMTSVVRIIRADATPTLLKK